MFVFFKENEVISHNQGSNHETLLHQSAIMYHSRYLTILRWWPRSRGVFLGISKALDKVWHEGLLYKLKQNGISGNLLNVITDPRGPPGIYS